METKETLRDHADQTQLLAVGGGNAAEIKGDSGAAGTEAGGVELLERALPEGGGDDAGKPAGGNGAEKKPGLIESIKGAFRRGAPCKSGECGKCKNCVTASGGKPFGSHAPKPAKAAVAEIVPRAADLSDALDASDSLEDFSNYGEAGSEFWAGVYEIRADNVREKFAKKLPPALVDRYVVRLGVSERGQANFRKFYAAGARSVGLPSGGGVFALGLAAHVREELNHRKVIREMLAEISKLPDLKIAEAPKVGRDTVRDGSEV